MTCGYETRQKALSNDPLEPDAEVSSIRNSLRTIILDEQLLKAVF